jgi:hypothetical protein
MTNDKQLEAGLRAMAEDFRLPGGGRKKLARLIAGHLWWFDAAERRGMGWGDMIRALAAAGVTGRSGKPLSVGTLSSTVWRKRAETAEAETDRQPRRPPPVERRREPVVEAKRPQAGWQRSGKPAASPRADEHDQTRRVVSMSPKRSAEGRRFQANKDVLAFMKRARSVRRRSEEE